ncbi:MAG: hypothetical protein MK213_01780 [Planctomycetes bacterium]|nr:hypothetical protein [Planctomycetota bacterium]
MNPLEGLLRLCDQIDSLQARKLDGKPDVAGTDTMRTLVASLRDEIYSQLPSLREHAAAANLSDAELLTLALLFHRRLSGDDRMVDGGSLIGLLGLAGYDRSQTLDLLKADGRLRTEGWLLSQAQVRAFDPVDTWFAATSAAFSLFWMHAPQTSSVKKQEESGTLFAYRDEEEYLWDLYGWRNMCMTRAEALFPADMPGGAPSPRFRTLRQDARTALTRVRRRLAMTPEAPQFQLEQFRHQHKLGMDHQLIVVHLLFSELVEGEPFISAIECLRVVSETRHDLFHRRGMVSPRGRLRRTGIVIGNDPGDLAKALATDLTLADWASDELVSKLGGPPRLDDRELDDFLRGDE